MCIFVQIIVLVSGPWKVREKSLKNGCTFLYEPCKTALWVGEPESLDRYWQKWKLTSEKAAHAN